MLQVAKTLFIIKCNALLEMYVRKQFHTNGNSIIGGFVYTKNHLHNKSNTLLAIKILLFHAKQERHSWYYGTK